MPNWVNCIEFLLLFDWITALSDSSVRSCESSSTKTSVVGVSINYSQKYWIFSRVLFFFFFFLFFKKSHFIFTFWESKCRLVTDFSNVHIYQFLINILSCQQCTLSSRLSFHFKLWCKNLFNFFFDPALLNTCRCAGARIEEFIYDKLDRKLPSKTTNAELLGQYMLDAANDFGPGTPYGQWRIDCFWLTRCKAER